MRTLLMVVSIVVAACGGSTSPTVGFDRDFTLAPGEIVQIDATGVAIRFVGVPSDSRCPADAICVTAGDAVVVLEIGNVRSSGDRYELHTRDLLPVRHGDLTIALVQLMPYPFTSRKIESGDYRATLRVTR